MAADPAPVAPDFTAPVDFDAELHALRPGTTTKGMFIQSLFDDAAKRAESAMRNSSLQGGYLIMAARALGLDCGPMSGVDLAKVNADPEFIRKMEEGQNVKSVLKF